MGDDCRYLGEQTGLRQCSTCRGGVKEKVFACQHPENGETTLRECRVCPDAWPADGPAAVSTWMIGVTTAPRETPTLRRCIESLKAAGWDDLHLFAEPATEIPRELGDLTLTRRAVCLGAYPNWYLTLAELFMRQPHADAYFVCQDDAVVSSGLREYLQNHLWPSPNVGVVSIYCPAHYGQGRPNGFHVEDHGTGTWGALAYVFPNPSTRAFLTDSTGLDHRHHGPGDGTRYVDGLVGKWCRDSGRPYYVHVPSLAQHIGDSSTLWSVPNAGKRRAETFEENALRLIENRKDIRSETAI